MIDDLVDDLKSDEGWEPSAYQDHLGFWTIGHGFLIDERKGGRLPVEIGEHWLIHLTHKMWNAFAKAEPWVLDQPEDVQRALGNMVYQMGVEGVRGFRKALAALQTGDRELAAKEALDSRWANQTPNRAKRVTDLMRGRDEN